MNKISFNFKQEDIEVLDIDDNTLTCLQFTEEEKLIIQNTLYFHINISKDIKLIHIMKTLHDKLGNKVLLLIGIQGLQNLVIRAAAAGVKN